MLASCSCCGHVVSLTPENWRCECGGAWDLVQPKGFNPNLVDRNDFSLWRYLQLYGLDWAQPACRMGVGWTPIIELPYSDRHVLFKLEYVSPTGSFKDRGISMVINILKSQGVHHVVEDSSGNAGAAVAAFASRAGIRAEIFVPGHASAVKQAQIAVYGAQVQAIPGPRNKAKHAAWQAAARGAAYASHAYHPGFIIGQQSSAWESWEQLDRQVPDWVLIPVGQGGHLLGYGLGFRRLLEAGLIDRLPRLVAVQPSRMAPVCRAFEDNLPDVPGVDPDLPSIAEGLAIIKPIRGAQLLKAIRDSGGTCIEVSETDIIQAQRQMAHKGIYIEPTSSAAVAALSELIKIASPEESILVPLTGTGLKGSPRLEQATQ